MVLCSYPVPWNQVPSSRTRLEPNPGTWWESMHSRVEPDLGPVPKWTPEPQPDQFLLEKTGSNSNPWFRVESTSHLLPALCLWLVLEFFASIFTISKTNTHCSNLLRGLHCGLSSWSSFFIVVAHGLCWSMSSWQASLCSLSPFFLFWLCASMFLSWFYV